MCFITNLAVKPSVLNDLFSTNAVFFDIDFLSSINFCQKVRRHILTRNCFVPSYSRVPKFDVCIYWPFLTKTEKCLQT